MAVSKRLRYEVLRRDNHACRYCGGSAPEVKLTVDHVVPTTLGGSDDPSNLVAACGDCNAGKSASSPDAAVVADVATDALRWSAAIKEATKIHLESQQDEYEYAERFFSYWNKEWCTDSGTPFVALPHDWESSILSFRRAGLSVDDLKYAADQAMRNTNIYLNKVWRYFCGICWRMVAERREIAASLIEIEDGVRRLGGFDGP
jgi:hypothetical protein